MAKLPERRRVAVWIWRRGPPDELLTHPHVSKGREDWGPLQVELAPGEHWPAALVRAVEQATGTKPLSVLDLELPNEFEVKHGPSAGAWKEKLFAAEVPAGTPAREGRWLVHYEAKAGASSPRARDGVTRLRERLRLKP
ncbi:MAG TPA: hypothetical protein VNZ52_00700 [Candidatus Thermoplasmatota archaeon]|nr:hypothetical protein [Candidatus Thermoplasmatota archaeon]